MRPLDGNLATVTDAAGQTQSGAKSAGTEAASVQAGAHTCVDAKGQRWSSQMQFDCIAAQAACACHCNHIASLFAVCNFDLCFISICDLMD